MKRIVALALVFLGLATGGADAFTRIKDISSILGVRENQLIGYGLVIGLQGTGDSMRNSPFTQRSLQAMLDRMGVNVTNDSLRVRNVASVMVTASLPAFANVGSRIDVEISSVGDAVSLRGGTLLMTPLAGADGKAYAVAQGPVTGAGVAAVGNAASVTEGVATGGRIPNGATIEKQVAGSLNDLGPLVIELYNPDFMTATLIADAVNAFTQSRYGMSLAKERDMRTVVLQRPQSVSATRFLAEIGELPVTPDTAAKVVINEKTGTVVIGQDVQISTVALTHGNLTIRVTETPVASQPPPFSPGQTVVLPRTQVSATEGPAYIGIVGGTSLQTLVDGLNQMGMKPSDIIAILQSIKSSGALQAELVVQ
ncbi:MAG: flagellar basal body P-ring protein FlgI [Rhizobiales bacterium]|nr:flagellar basal body P-ring protein FlgI [Hyphomicrobiales bacterium]